MGNSRVGYGTMSLKPVSAVEEFKYLGITTEEGIEQEVSKLIVWKLYGSVAVKRELGQKINLTLQDKWFRKWID